MDDIKVSIIICCYNSVGRIEPTLQAIHKQVSSPVFKLELIIVNNASTDDTGILVPKLCAKLFSNEMYKCIDEPNPGLIHARKRGFAESSGDIIIFCDDDNHLYTSYCQIATSMLLENPQIGALGGIGELLDFKIDLPEWVNLYQGMYAIGSQSHAEGPVAPPTLYGAGLVIRRQILEKLFSNRFESMLVGRKGQALSSGEDTELTYMIGLMGHEVWYSPRLKFYHDIPQNRFSHAHFNKLVKGIGKSMEVLLPYKMIWEKKVTPITSNWYYHFTKRIFFLFYGFIFNPRKRLRFVEFRLNLERLKVVAYRRSALKSQIEKIRLSLDELK